MKRLVAGLTGTLVIGAVAAVIVAPGMASSAAKPGVASTSAKAAPSLTVQMAPPSGQEAVKTGDTVTFSGRVDPAPPASTLKEAWIRIEGPDGQRCKAFGTTDKPTDYNVAFNYLNFESDGRITGSAGLPNLGADSKYPSCHGGRIILRVTAMKNIEPGKGETTTVESNSIPIDVAGPAVMRSHLIAPDKILVRFTEPAHLQGQPDLTTDWEVDGVPPLTISGEGATRTLTIAPAKDQDATPTVSYVGVTRRVENRNQYHDTSANNKYTGLEDLPRAARDVIPPPTPVVDSVAGQNGTTAVSNDPTPEIRISSIRTGHWAQVYREMNGVDGLQRPGDAFVGEDQAASSGAQVTVADLESDGDYKLYVIARDNALCEPPDGTDICPNWSGANNGSTIQYALDRVGPIPLFASVTNIDEITVGFSEAIFGSNNTSNWTVDGAIVTAVTGSGDRRRLIAPGADPGAVVTYTPGDLRDDAHNPVPQFSKSLLDQLPPLVQVTNPANDQFVQATEYTMEGTAEKANQVQIFRDTNADGAPDGPAVATTAVEGNAWSVSVPLNADASNRFVARGIRTDSDPPIQGPDVPISSALVQDSQNPTLSVDALAPAYRDTIQVDISWTADDANLGGGPMTLEFSKDGGTTWELIEAFYPDTSPYEEWITPEVATKTALIRVTATDRAGRSTAQQTPAFEIDPINPIFTAAIETARKVLVKFSEPVNGLLNPLEWKINGETVGSIEPVGHGTGVTAVTLTVAPTEDELDPTVENLVTYKPLSTETDLEDHVGNPIVEPAATGGGNQNNGDGGGDFTTPAKSANSCTILGTDGADTLVGTDGPDIICPLGGTDRVEALGGNDTIVMAPGGKTVDGGAGNDEINGGDGFDTLNGGPGDDVILGYGGDDQISGDDGNDALHGDEGSDTVSGGNGIDIVEGEGGDDVLRGDAGIDHLAGSDGNDVLEGGDDDDRLIGHDGDDQLNGDDGHDFLEGADGVDILRGGGGNDQLSGSAARDQLFGDSGNDKLEGGDDKDRVDGGSGNDVVNGGNNDDFIIGGTGNDKGNGGTGKDRLQGESGKDVLTGGDENDRLEGGSGNDKLEGGDDNDSLYGGTGSDLMLGEDGRDRLYGDQHSDRLFGGSQRDRLDGGTSRDYCDGGPGGDARLGCEGGPQS